MSNFHPAPNDDRSATFSVGHANNEQGAWLNPYTLWNAEAERHALLFRNAREAEELRLMRHPIATREAFDILGLLLGACVPATIFYRMFNYGIAARGSGGGLLLFPLLLLAMNLVCCLMGGKMGGVFGERIDSYERASWHRMCVCSAGAGALWGFTTGAVGGVLFFGFGSLFGALIALPVGMLGFGLFTPLHRLMARGGMIDARHFWPLACGVVLTISALILGLNIYPA